MSAQSGESSSAVLSSPFVSAFSIVCSVFENAVPSALSDAEISVIALGTPVMPVTPCAVSWIWAVSVSSVVDNVSSALLTSSPESVSGAPRSLSESTSCCVDVLRVLGRRLEPVLREVRRVRELLRDALQVVLPCRDGAAEAARPGGRRIRLLVATAAASRGHSGERDDDQGGCPRSAHRRQPSGSAPRRGRAPARRPTPRARGGRVGAWSARRSSTTLSVAPDPSRDARTRTPARLACQLDVTSTTSSASSRRVARPTPIALPSVVRAPRSTIRALTGVLQDCAMRSASALAPRASIPAREEDDVVR